jgi:hypothetical protein
MPNCVQWASSAEAYFVLTKYEHLVRGRSEGAVPTVDDVCKCIKKLIQAQHVGWMMLEQKHVFITAMLWLFY